MKKYIVYIVIFAVLLAAIPVLINAGYVSFAKIIGFLLVISISVALRVWLKQSSKIKTQPDGIKFTVNERFTLNSLSPIYQKASTKEKKHTENLLGRFLANSRFDQTENGNLSQQDCLAVSLLAIYTQEEQKILTSLATNHPKTIVFDKVNQYKIENLKTQTLLFINPQKVAELLQNSFTKQELRSNSQEITDIIQAYLAA